MKQKDFDLIAQMLGDFSFEYELSKDDKRGLLEHFVWHLSFNYEDGFDEQNFREVFKKASADV